MYFLLVVLTFCASTVRSSDLHCTEIKCVQEELIQFLEEVDKNSLRFMNGSVTLEKINRAESGRSDVLGKITNFLISHDLKYESPLSSFSGDLFNEPRTKKIKKFLLPLLLILKFTAAIVIPAAFFFVSTLSVKGIAVNLMALAVAFGVILNSLLHAHHPKLSYEVVPQVYWGRIGAEPLATALPESVV